MNPIPLLIALAAAPAAPAVQTGTDIASALEACEKLPIDAQRACVEPWLDQPEAATDASPQEINDRRARLENAEGLRLARSL